MNTFRKPTLAPLPTVQDWAAQADAVPQNHDRPWLNEDPTRSQPLHLARLPAQLHAKLVWLKKNLPGGPSIHQQAVDAIEEYANRMIAELEEERAQRERHRQP
jgi:hypothetical protein